MGSSADEDRARVVAFWRAVEIFNPQIVPAANAQRNVYEFAGTGPLPWEPGHPVGTLELKADQVWRHTVYGGIFDVQPVRDLLQDTFGADAESFDARPSGHSALFVLTVTDEGRPLLGSEEFSSCGWAVGRLLKPGPQDRDWLTGFDEASDACYRAFMAMAEADEDDVSAAMLKAQGYEVGRPLGADDLLGLVADLTGRFAVADALSPARIRVASKKVPKSRAFVTDGGELLNSFFVTDLATCADAVEQGDCGAALRLYLRGPDSAEGRVDVVKQPEVVDEGVAPQLTPAGRWPARAGQSLSLSQQFAANTIMRELSGEPGLFAVNGPPGTGKTTMLRELVAAIVVERACRLAELASSSDAFTSPDLHWKTNNYARTISVWNKRLTGFEIIVASSNNGAVENISLEIPGIKAIDHDEWSAHADYYRALATELLSRAGEGGRSATPAWGLIAGLLGRKLNRTKFVSTFWFGQNDANPVIGLQDILKEYEKHPADWPAAVRRFRAVLDEVEALRTERTAVYVRLAELARVQVRIEQHETTLRTASIRLEQAVGDVARAAVATARAEHEEKITIGARESHWRFRPALLARVLGLGKSVRQWRARDGELAAIMAEAERKSREARAREADLKFGQRQATEEVREAEAGLGVLRSRFKELDDDIAEARRHWGESVPSGDLTDARRRELAGAWTDPQWNAARSRLFLAALRLHQDFLAAEPAKMRKSLHGAMDVVTGTVGQGASAEAVHAAWQSLFFVVPVLSTTFASFARVFSHLGRESLGWLFIDEAGQATPQAAAGAIWRSRRVIVVGDPMQLEPVVTLPFTAQQALRDHFGVAEWWLPGLSSAQRLADAANNYGTWLPADDGSVWVGAPLRAHRRCVEPMFTISNLIAYNGLMVHGTADPVPALAAPESSWIDVSGDYSEGNWVPREGEQAKRILSALIQRYGVEPDRIFILSPFRDGAAEIKKILSKEPRLRGGTVHTAQGKEADVVIFILGSNPNKPGTRQWASQRPNLVNVAVSRARQRLYVIGDFALWSEFPYFRELARRLHRQQPK